MGRELLRGVGGMLAGWALAVWAIVSLVGGMLERIS